MQLGPKWLRLLSVLRQWFCWWWSIVKCASHCLWEFCVCLCFVMYYFVSVLVMQSFERGKKRLLLCYNCLTDVLFLYMSCGFSLWLWYFLIILTYVFVSKQKSHANKKSVKFIMDVFVFGVLDDLGDMSFKSSYLHESFPVLTKNAFYQGDKYLCCMNNLYISLISLYAPTYSFWAIRSMLISIFKVTSWFDTVWNIVIR